MSMSAFVFAVVYLGRVLVKLPVPKTDRAPAALAGTIALLSRLCPSFRCTGAARRDQLASLGCCHGGRRRAWLFRERLRQGVLSQRVTSGLPIVLAALLITGLCGPAWADADEDAEPATKSDTTEPMGGGISYQRDVQPIFNKRCIACHGCLGSPCNLKLDSYAGAERGAFGLNPYTSHIRAYPRTDMDAAKTLEQWREIGFWSVLTEAEPRKASQQTAKDGLDGSLMAQFLEAGNAHNQPGFSREALAPAYADRFEYGCPATPDAAATLLAANAAMGMPFGLPAIDADDFAVLKRWIAAGAPGPSDEELRAAAAPARPDEIAHWEAFFNAPDPRHQLVARFIFDHVYLATIVLEESPGERFRLVRSTTPPGAPIDVIGTGLPYDDPYAHAGVDRFWYRLQKKTEAPMQKNLFLWRLKHADREHLERLFFGPDGRGADWSDSAPLEPPWGIGNPFSVFRAIPAEARYRFLLENAETVTSGVIYGPVCNGQTATYAVKDHFWVFFVDPAADPSVQDPKLGLSSWEALMDRSVFGNAAYVDAYNRALTELRPKGWSVGAIWDGDGTNTNAWLTVMRHDTNVSVVRGGQGGTPRTLWLMTYSGLERMYYDTVASFEYWAGDLSKLQTLLFFNYLRQEFEDNFLMLLPPADREAVRKTWTQGVGSLGLDLIPFAADDRERDDGPGDATASLQALIEAVEEHFSPAIAGPPDRLNPDVKPKIDLAEPITSLADWERALSTLTVVQGLPFSRFLPSVIVVRLDGAETTGVYSLVVNRVYESQYTLVFQDGQALPDLYSLSVYPTIINGFPNLFVDLDLDQAGDFLDDLRNIENAADWEQFQARHAILRNSARLWPFYDWVNGWNVQHRQDAAGYLDLSYYDTPQ